MTLNRLTEKHLKVADRMFASVLCLWGYVESMAIAADTSGWDDPVFAVVHKIPFTPYSWALGLFIAVSVYAAGELMSHHYPHRGKLIIAGATLCMFWHLAMAIAMSRMVYELPTRITDLWPLIMFIMAVLYATRIIIYSNIFYGQRWNTNPYQLWATLFLMVVSMSQMIIGVAPSSVFTEVEHPVAFQVATVNFLGAAIVMTGLHLRNQDRGLSLELAGTVSLVATLGWYVSLVLHKENLAGTTLGIGLVEAFLFATLHRSIQIISLKWAQFTKNEALEKRLADALYPSATNILVVRPEELPGLCPDDDSPVSGG
jgi:hypothetical protein